MEKTYSLDELDAMDSEAVDAETANTYGLDDLERLDSWSSGSNVLQETAVSFGKGIAADIVRIPDEIGQLIKETGEKGGAGMAIPSFNDGVNIARRLTGKEIELGKQDEFLINAGEMLSKKTQGFMGRMNLEPEEGSRLSEIAFDIGAGASSVATSLGLLYATRSPSLLFGLFGARQKGSIYKEATEAGKDPETASILSSAAGLVEGGIEAIGGTAFLKSMSFNKFLTKALFRTAEQGLEEGMQQAGEEVLTKMSGVRKDTVMDSLLRVGYASALGIVLGGTAGSITASLEKTRIKSELRAAGFTSEQANTVIQKVVEKNVNDATLKQEILTFLEEEISVTEKALNENPNATKAEASEEAATATATIDENDIYAKNFEMRQKGETEGTARKIYDKISGAISQVAEPISTRLNKMNPKLKTRMRKYEYNVKQRTLEDEKLVRPFLEASQKLSPKDQSDLDLALKNNDTEKIKEVTERNRMTQEYQDSRDTLNALYVRAKDTGVDVGFIEDYYPRKVKDFDGMMKFFQKQDQWPEMQKAMAEKESSLGRAMTDDEKAELLNTLLSTEPKKGKKPGNLKKRKISQVTPELNKFYQDSPQALLQYIYRVNDFIEARRFFGKSVKGSDMSQKTLEDSIGSFVLDLLQEGEISGRQAKELSEILHARFSNNQPGEISKAVRNITYMETMGSVTSAVTQIGDIAFSLYKNGFYRTGKALSDSLTGQAQITKEDIGIERIAEEFSEKTKTAAALDWVFKHIGLNWMDRLGKETQINAAFDKYAELASNPSPQFNEQMEIIFGDEAGEVIEDLKSKTPSDNVKFLLFSELADVQPIALSEMPEQYLKSGNGRLLYMLKTFSIKQIDVFRNEVFLKMKDNPKEAIGNLLRLASLLMLANGTADLIKDLILNRPIEPEDYVIDNFLRLFGISKFSLMKFKTESVSAGVSSFVVPPLGKFISSGAKDVDKMLKGEFEPEDAEIIQSIPILGKIYYWWFGGGSEKGKKKKSKGRKF